MKDTLLSILGKWLNPSMDRRRFLKTSTALASAVAAGSALLRPRPARAGLYALCDPDPV